MTLNYRTSDSEILESDQENDEDLEDDDDSELSDEDEDDYENLTDPDDDIEETLDDENSNDFNDNLVSKHSFNFYSSNFHQSLNKINSNLFQLRLASRLKFHLEMSRLEF